MSGFSHLPVMPAEVLEYLAPHPGGVYLDGTLGGGGHARIILKAGSPDALLVGVDRDREALEAAGRRLQTFGDRFIPCHGNHAEAARFLETLGISRLDGFLLDLGVSSHQIDSAVRGFSFQADGPLDMRMDSSTGDTAADLVNNLPERELERIIKEYGEERWAKRIASFIVAARVKSPILTTLQLVDIIKGAVPRAKWEEHLHPATRTFQAVRIAVNGELESLQNALKTLVDTLKSGGRGVVISFHSLEDRIVKTTFRECASGCICPPKLPYCSCGVKARIRLLNSRPITASAEEAASNPRSRSAKLRAIEKL